MTRVVCMAVAVVVLSGAVQPSAAQAPPDSRTNRPTLSERTSAAGGRLQERIDPGDVPVITLDELTARAPVVIIGRALAMRSRLGADERHVNTEVAFSVHSRVKGTVQPGALVYVRAAGGSHRYPDGRTVHQIVAGFRTFRVDATYVVFLRPLIPGRSAPAVNRGQLFPERAQYELAAGPQGAFELDYSTSAVIPAAGAPEHPLATRYATVSLRDFLRELFRAADLTRRAGGR